MQPIPRKPAEIDRLFKGTGFAPYRFITDPQDWYAAPTPDGHPCPTILFTHEEMMTLRPAQVRDRLAGHLEALAADIRGGRVE